jgi:hypothetical protein
MQRQKITICILISLNFILFLLFASGVRAQTFQWAKKFGGTSFSETQPASMICDNSGNIYITGMFGGTVDFDPGAAVFNLTSYGSAYDAYVVKLSSSGNFIFALHFGGAGSVTRGTIIRLDGAGNIYVAGTSTNTADFDPGTGVLNLTSNTFDDIFICKLNPAGNLLWAKRAGGNDYDRPSGLIFDAFGNPVITGEFSTSVDFDPGAGTTVLTSAGFSDIYIWKLDASGNFMWVKQIGGVNSDEAKSIDKDASGNLYITGYYNGNVDFDPGTGIFNLNNTAGLSMFVLKLDGAGNFQWAKSAGGRGNCFPNDLKISAANNIYITGSFRDTVDFDPAAGVSTMISAGIEDVFIWKLNSSGGYTWAKRIGNTGVDKGIMLFTDNTENLFLTGYFQDNIDLDPGAGVQNKVSQGVYDMFTIKLNAAGNFQFGYSTGGSGYDEGYAAAMNPASCNLVVSGPFQQTVDFDPGAASFNLTAGSSSADTYIQQISGIGGVCSTPLPVELTEFTATPADNSIELKWTTASEVNNKGFELERSASDENNFKSIWWTDGNGNTTNSNNYFFEDKNVKSGSVYYYRLKQLDYNGTFQYSHIVKTKLMEDDFSFTVSPNPFHLSSTLNFSLKENAYVKVEVFNSLGMKILTITDKQCLPGAYSYYFDLKESGLNSGVYTIRILIDETPYFLRVVKM